MAKTKEAPVVTFEPIQRYLRHAQTNQKKIAATIKRTGRFDREDSIRKALNQIERLQKIEASVWGPGFEEERQSALGHMWMLVGRIQDSKAPTVEPENADSWNGADREAYENAVFITLEEAEREGI